MIQVAQIIFILSVLVILHEFGHYIAAKAFKVRVEKFYLFMDAGFSLFKKKIGETEWGIGWLPIGGYVKLSGMIDESMDMEQMNQEPQPWEFRSKPAWQRLIIMLGGIIVNILLAITIYTVMFTTVGQKYISTEVVQKNGLSFTQVGKDVGFKNGDKIVSVDGVPVQSKFNRLIIDVLLSDKIVVNRNGKDQEVVLTDESKAKILGSDGKSFMGSRLELNNICVDSVSKTSKVPLIKGDIIIGLNNKYFTFLDQVLDQVKKNELFQLNVIRNQDTISMPVKADKNGDFGITKEIFFSELYDINKTFVREVTVENNGILLNDKIIGVNNVKYKFVNELRDNIEKRKNQTLELNIIRNNKEIVVKSKTNDKGRLGIKFGGEKSKLEIVNKLSFSDALVAAGIESWQLLTYNVKQFRLILKPKTEAYKQVKSPIGIARMLPNEWNWEFIWSFTALFSIGLAFMNLLPIPGLDGGHALFTIAEMVTGKKLSEKNMGYVQTAGMIILLSLMALTFGKDIYQLIMDKFFMK